MAIEVTTEWPQPELPDVTIKMSMNEARMLRAILGHCGGNGAYWVLSSRLYDALTGPVRASGYDASEMYLAANKDIRWG